MKIETAVPPPEREFGFWAKLAEKMPMGASVAVESVEDARSLCRAIRNHGTGKPTYKKQKKGYRVWKLEG
jgi:hypothetical protein